MGNDKQISWLRSSKNTFLLRTIRILFIVGMLLSMECRFWILLMVHGPQAQKYGQPEIWSSQWWLRSYGKAIFLTWLTFNTGSDRGLKCGPRKLFIRPEKAIHLLFSLILEWKHYLLWPLNMTKILFAQRRTYYHQ